VKIGVLGAGDMGAMHARIYAGMPGAELKGVCGRSKARSAPLAKELGVACYAGYGELLSDVEAVDICAPTREHARAAVRALEAGKHAIIEFPVCADSGELDAIFRAAKESGKSCFVSYFSRCQSQYGRAFDLAASGAIGTVNGLSISRMSQDYFSGSDIVNDLLSQDIDFMHRLLGKPRSIGCAASEKDLAIFDFDYGNFTAIIEGRTDMHPGFPFTTRHFISGATGSIDLRWRFSDGKPSYIMEIGSAGGIERVEAGDYDPYRRELELIVGAMERGDSDGALSLASVMEPARLAFASRDIFDAEKAVRAQRRVNEA
jgi:UDP-N-acetylglucosamine 3-dehydrogenase